MIQNEHNQIFVKIIFPLGLFVIIHSPLALSDDRLTERSRQTYGFTFGGQTSSTEFGIILDHGQSSPFVLRCLQNAPVFSLIRTCS